MHDIYNLDDHYAIDLIYINNIARMFGTILAVTTNISTKE
jgi:hypothetical protein